LKAVVALFSVVLVTAAGVAVSPAAGVTAGLHGRVCRGPLPPVGAAGRCTKPLRLTLVFTRAGRTHTVRAATDGTYRAVLPAGVYRVQTPFRVGVKVPRLRPALVRVRAGHDDALNFYLDLTPL
jgi:hypothetical protein